MVINDDSNDDGIRVRVGKPREKYIVRHSNLLSTRVRARLISGKVRARVELGQI